MRAIDQFDVIIIGAGPAGSAAAIELGKAGHRVAIIDKNTFPRDKICGDALSVDVINQLEKLAPELATQFAALPEKTASYGVKIVAPNHQEVDIPFIHEHRPRCGYVCPRLTFDDLLFRHLATYKSLSVYPGTTVESIERKAGQVLIKTENQALVAPLLIGADGAHSMVARKVANLGIDKKHHSAGLRVYYEQVHGFSPDHKIELHFFNDILPGYLWIFPLPNGRANVGIGMLSSVISAKRINLKKVLQNLLENHPALQARFRHAHPVESIKGLGLPLGSIKRTISGDRYLLVGDAAGLIDPFSGEGIANAIRSGRIAAEHAVSCLQQRNFTREFNRTYDQHLYRKIGDELKISFTLQRLCHYPWLFNFVVRKACSNKYVHDFLVASLANVGVKKQLSNPFFYFKLLFR